jgi:hypothetical protein
VCILVRGGQEGEPLLASGTMAPGWTRGGAMAVGENKRIARERVEALARADTAPRS